jgi:hypothetical protein
MAAWINIIPEKSQENFVFVVEAKGTMAHLGSLTEFASRMPLTHPSPNNIVHNPDLNDEFLFFFSVGSDSTIRVSKANLEFFASLSQEFGDANLYISLLGDFDSDFNVSSFIIRRRLIFLVTT